MEIRMDSADVQSLACKDTFVSLRVGDCQKQSRLVATRTYKFAADTQDAKSSFGRIEVFKRIGAHTVAFDTLSGEGGQEVEVSCSDPELAALRLSLFVNKTAVVADGKEPAKERNSQKKKQMEDAKRYLDEHALEELIAVAMREVIRKRPEEPRQFLCDQIIAAKSKAKAPPKAAEKPAENSAPPPVPEVSAMKSAPPAEDNARVAACAVLQEANASGILSAELSKFAKAVEESGPPPVPSAEHKSAAKETVANENEDLQAADEAAKSAPPLVAASSSSKNGKSLPAHAWAAMHGRFPQKSAPAAQKSAPAAQDNVRVAACAVLQEANASGNLSAELSKFAKVQQLPGPAVIFVLGGPGAGKGTQCERIADRYGYTHLSAGDLLRAERKREGSEYGQLIESYIKDGKIVPVEITVNLIRQAMEQTQWEGGKYLVDGFPRSFDNLDGWNKVLGGKVTLRFALCFDCSEACMEARLLERGKTSGRSDDNMESIRKRFKTFENESKPVLERFAAEGSLRRIDATQDVEAVWAEVEKLLSPAAGAAGSQRSKELAAGRALAGLTADEKAKVMAALTTPATKKPTPDVKAAEAVKGPTTKKPTPEELAAGRALAGLTADEKAKVMAALTTPATKKPTPDVKALMPTVDALAAASDDEVKTAIQGFDAASKDKIKMALAAADGSSKKVP